MVLVDQTPWEARMHRWAYGGLWVFVCAFLVAPARDALESVFALGFFIPMLLLLPWRKPVFARYGGWFSVSALLYASWSCISTLWGDVSGRLLAQWLVLVTWLLGAAWVLSYRPLNVDQLMRWLVGLGCVSALASTVVFYSSHPLSERLEAFGILRTPTVAGQVYGLLALLAIILSWRSVSFIQAILWSVLALIPLLGVGLSQSRGPVMALAVSLPLALWWFRPALRVWSVQLAAALVCVILLWLLTPLESLLLLRGTSLRDQIWIELWRAMQADPMTIVRGVGMSESTVITTAIGEFHHAHNAWLDLFYRTGVIGLLLVLVHLALLLFTPRRTPHIWALRAWLIYGCVCLLVDSRSLFWEIDAKWLLYWVPAALLAALLMNGYQREPESVTVAPAVAH